ncbi:MULTISPECIES: MarR family winged helix-turn-helix transcriptional regulator [unclassified Beijerinckia]|uniref:MarR family winged helix-turn-helix transcriptional regulator n=1 Tax=unclassified Beijerinckia TaxID=2638183 RepID=UPI0008981097|nr:MULTISPECIES: MarR family winged helix-turn-helix transcriptional regulator [unclassified Beijerinckia]MDH7797724.1 DNA-binding MarR family transcriptional regulator [Beijerinckia sp. GAS462]SEC96392.1 DNA-binding transcriptional regulator, MarR family [Beijerinckia sp. 28-YEA-48]
MSKFKKVQHTPEGATITDLIITIFRANGALLRVGDALMKDLGVTSTRWQVLGGIGDAPKTVAQIARDFGLSRQGVLWVVQTLVKDGIVEQVDNPNHRRAQLVQLTTHGRKLLDEINGRQAVWSNAVAEGMSATELKKALAAIKRLHDKVVASAK